MAKVDSRKRRSVRVPVLVACVVAILFSSAVGFCASGQILSASAEPCYRGTTVTLHLSVLNTSSFAWGVDNCPAYMISVRTSWPGNGEMIGYRWAAVIPGIPDAATFVGGQGPPVTGTSYIEISLLAPESPGSCRYVLVDQARIPIECKEWPDLVIIGSVAQTQGTTSDPLTISFRVTNLGPGPVIRASWVEVRLSQDRTFDFNNAVDPWVASQVVLPPMAPGEYRDYCTTGSVPDAPGGNLNIIMKCDVLNEVAESVPAGGENNNEFVVPTPFTIYRAELSVRAGAQPINPTTATIGSPIFVSFLIDNTGNLPSPVCVTEVWLSPYPAAPWAGQHWFDVATSAIQPVYFTPATAPWAVPYYVPPATYHVFAICDPQYLVDEYDKQNNVRDLGTLLVSAAATARANLVVAQGRVTLGAGGQSRQAHVEVTVGNDGDEPASATKMALYLSSSGVWRPTDPVWASDISVPSLNPGASFDCSVNLSLPSWAKGNYRVIARCDAAETIEESDENNDRDIGALSSLTGADHWSLYR